MTPYGMELLLDLKDRVLTGLSKKMLLDYFVGLCDRIRMKRHGEPYFWEDTSDVPHLHGISAIQFIETSNVVCHPLPLLNSVYVNVFSCKEFDVDLAKRFSMEFWGARSAVANVITRT